MTHRSSLPLVVIAAPLIAAMALGCSGSDSGSPSANKTDAAYQQEIVTGMHDSLVADIAVLVEASATLGQQAPAGAWDQPRDQAAISSMKDTWARARTAYEHIEGAIAPLFSELDGSLDARYDDQLAAAGGKDDNLFDGEGITGLHAVERILWSDSIPEAVATFEKALPGYQPAAFPATDQEGADFKSKLCARLAADAKTLQEQWTPQKIDLGGSFDGLVSLMNEQREKVNKASSFEEESRYSQRTMRDIRDNLEGTTKIYRLFQPWLRTKENTTDPQKDGKTVDAAIESGFAKVATLYGMTTGDAIPQPPSTWSSEHPSTDDLASPFGVLYQGVSEIVDPNKEGSVVYEMNSAATILKFPGFKEEAP
jgi:iron uptake system component EfeO